MCTWIAETEDWGRWADQEYNMPLESVAMTLLPDGEKRTREILSGAEYPLAPDTTSTRAHVQEEPGRGKRGHTSTHGSNRTNRAAVLRHNTLLAVLPQQHIPVHVTGAVEGEGRVVIQPGRLHPSHTRARTQNTHTHTYAHKNVCTRAHTHTRAHTDAPEWSCGKRVRDQCPDWRVGCRRRGYDPAPNRGGEGERTQTRDPTV